MNSEPDIQKIRVANLKRLVSEYATQVEFASHYGLDASYVSQILGGHRGFGERSARNFEKKMGLERLSLDAVHGGMAEEPSVTPGPINKGEIPIISWVQAGDLCEVVDNFHPGDAESWVQFRPPNAGPRAFALWVRGKSNYPKFQEGEIILVDPDQHADPGKFVIAKRGNDEATLKQLVYEDGQHMLKAFNPDWPRQYIMMDETWHICGVVIGKVQLF